MNLVAPHLMVELRSAGFIEICGDLDPVPWADGFGHVMALVFSSLFSTHGVGLRAKTLTLNILEHPGWNMLELKNET